MATSKKELREALQRLVLGHSGAYEHAKAILARPAVVVAFRVVTPTGVKFRWDVRSFHNEEQAHGYAKVALEQCGGKLTKLVRR